MHEVKATLFALKLVVHHQVSFVMFEGYSKYVIYLNSSSTSHQHTWLSYVFSTLCSGFFRHPCIVCWDFCIINRHINFFAHTIACLLVKWAPKHFFSPLLGPFPGHKRWIWALPLFLLIYDILNKDIYIYIYTIVINI